jgi:hypothetical protein
MKASVVLAVLIKLKEQVEQGTQYSKELGICYNVEYLLEDDKHPDIVEYLKPAFKQWPEYSGNGWYPVPAFSLRRADDEYLSTYNLWVGEYGECRKRLLDFLIDYYTDEVSRETNI